MGVLNEATKEGNKSIDELKKGTAIKQMQQVKEDASKLLKTEKELKTGINALEYKKRSLEGQIEGLESQVRVLGEGFSGQELKHQEIYSIHPKRTMLGTIKDVSVEDIENLKKMASEYLQIKCNYERLEIENKRLNKMVPSIQERLQQEKDRIRLEQLERALKSIPVEVRQKFLPEKSNKRNLGVSHER